MSEQPSPDVLTPPERDETAQPTAEQRRRRRRTIWLIVRLALLVLLIVLVLWGMVSCVNALSGAMQPTSAPPVGMVGAVETVDAATA
jgi:type VI protein secretion system component VasF